MEAKIEIITPELAKAFLKKNINNYRKFDTRRINTYAADMKTGKWQFNGESIKFNENDELVDGQHRLMAIIKADEPIKMLVIYGVKNDVNIYDSGKNRTLLETACAYGLTKGAKDNSTLGAARYLISGGFSTNAVPKGVIMDYMKRHEHEWQICYQLVDTGCSKKRISKKSPILLACYCLCKTGYPTRMLAEFFSIVNSGFPNEEHESSSAIVLRNFLLDGYHRYSSKSERDKVTFSTTCCAYIDFLTAKKRRKIYNFDATKLKLINEVIEMENLKTYGGIN